MRNILKLSAALITSGVLLSGCLSSETPTTDGPNLSECPVYSASDAYFWINAMPSINGGGAPLHLKFNVTAPTPDYSFEGKVTSVRESAPPQFVVELIPTEPKGVVADVITETEVHLTMSAQGYKEIASVDVMCGGELLISGNVETVY